MAITKKKITDAVFNIVDRFKRTDESRIDETYLGFLIDEVRADLIGRSYLEFGIIDAAWLTDLSLKSLHTVNFADDPSVGYCCFDVSKVTIPPVVSLPSKTDSGIDLGLYTVISACGTREYTYYPLTMWKQIPSEHPRSKFNYYARVNTSLYVNKKVDSLRLIGILLNPEDGYIINSTPVASGSIASTIGYTVKNGTIIYRGVAYETGETFTGNADTSTFSGDGNVYLTTQIQAISETSAYPVTGEMARQIVLEICTKELQLEASQISDQVNDSIDDELKK